MPELNHTHDPAARSWVASANAADADFPLQNLPYAMFAEAGTYAHWRAGVAIGDQVLDLKLSAAQAGWPADVQPLLAPLAAATRPTRFSALDSSGRSSTARITSSMRIVSTVMSLTPAERTLSRSCATARRTRSSRGCRRWTWRSTWWSPASRCASTR